MEICKRSRSGVESTQISINGSPEQNPPKTTRFFLLDLPSFIILDILLRLPLKSVLHCRSVCKILLTLISNPYFTRIYHQRHPFLVLSLGYSFFLLQLGDGYDYTHISNNKPRMPNTFYSVYFQKRRIKIVGSCNGFLCLLIRSAPVSHSTMLYSIQIVNPVLGEYVTLPREEVSSRDIIEAYGFGFSPITGQYKVIRIKLKTIKSENAPDVRLIKGQVWTLGTGKWRKVRLERGKVSFPIYGKFCSVTLHGAIHWIGIGIGVSRCFNSFDVGEERVGMIPLPAGLGSGNSLMWCLGVLQNCLCVFDNSDSTFLDIWSMKEYGVARSWSKDRILKVGTHDLNGLRLQPLTHWKDGEILIVCEGGFLVSYDPIRMNFTKLNINGIDSLDHVEYATYALSSLSLKDCTMGASLDIKKYFKESRFFCTEF